MTEAGSTDIGFPSRGEKLSHPFFCVGNETWDLYVPIIGADCWTVYSFFARKLHSNPDLKHDIRSLALSCDLGTGTVSRALEVLEHLKLIKLTRFSGNRASKCQLSDAWTVATLLGATFDSELQCYRFPAEVSERLRAEIAAIRERQQGKSRGKAKRLPENTCGNLTLSFPHGNSSVSLEKRQRSTRETQPAAHLIRKEERTKRTPSPTPSPDGELWKTKNLANEDGPVLELLRWARVEFTGVINDMKTHLFDTSLHPNPRFRNGYQDWEDFGFGHMAIEAAEFRGGVLVLTISAPDPMAAQRGLDKYRRAWESSIRKWFEGKVSTALVKARE